MAAETANHEEHDEYQPLEGFEQFKFTILKNYCHEDIHHPPAFQLAAKDGCMYQGNPQSRQAPPTTIQAALGPSSSSARLA